MASVTAFHVNLQDYRSLFVVKPSSLGDIVHTVPTVRLIKAHAPHLKIRWICNPEWKPILQEWTDLEEIIEFPRKSLRGIKAIPNAFKFSKVLKQLPREHPELVIDFQGLLRSAIISKFRKAHKVVGFSDSREGSFLAHDHIVQVSPDQHAVDRYLNVLPHLGISYTQSDVVFPLESNTDLSAFQLPERYVLFHPYSRGKGKSMETEAVDAFIEQMNPFPVVLVGVKADHVPLQKSNLLDLVNQTSIPALIQLCKKATACVSVDSGPMHIASAVNSHTLGIHTWTLPSKVGPYLQGSVVWKAGRVAARKELNPQENATVQAFQTKDVATLSHFLKSHWIG